MQSKIKEVGPTGQTWSQNGKTFYVYDVVLEDGTVGQANSTSSDGTPYKAGDLVEYSVTRETQYGKTLKIQKADAPGAQGSPQGAETQKRIDASWAVGQAVALGHNTEETIMTTALDLLKVRDKIMAAR